MIRQAKEHIIGFGPAAASLVEGLLSEAEAEIELTVFSAEKHLACNRVLLAQLAIGSTRAEFQGLANETGLRAAGVTL